MTGQLGPEARMLSTVLCCPPQNAIFILELVLWLRLIVDPIKYFSMCADANMEETFYHEKELALTGFEPRTTRP